MTLAENRETTAQDVTLQCLANLIRLQSWKNLENLSQQFQEADQMELNLFKRVKGSMMGQTSSLVTVAYVVVPAPFMTEPTPLHMKVIKVW